MTLFRNRWHQIFDWRFFFPHKSKNLKKIVELEKDWLTEIDRSSLIEIEIWLIVIPVLLLLTFITKQTHKQANQTNEKSINASKEIPPAFQCLMHHFPISAQFLFNSQQTITGPIITDTETRQLLGVSTWFLQQQSSYTAFSIPQKNWKVHKHQVSEYEINHIGKTFVNKHEKSFERKDLYPTCSFTPQEENAPVPVLYICSGRSGSSNTWLTLSKLAGETRN